MRLVRAGFAAAVITVASGAAHVLAGGRMPLWVALALFAGTFAAALPLTRRRLSSGQLLGLLLVTQAVTHGVADASATDGRMLAAHLVATGTSLLILRWGEDVLRRLWDWLSLRFERPRPVRVRSLGRLTWPVERPTVVVAFDPAAPRRGPPAVHA